MTSTHSLIERLRRGEWVELNGSPDLQAAFRRCKTLLARLRTMSTHDADYRLVVSSLIPDLPDTAMLMPPFHCDLGINISLGERVFVNAGCTFLDLAPIHIGAHTLVGPCVQLLTPIHPTDYRLRRTGLESAQPVSIGPDCWLGGGVVVCPGVTIGARTVVGAGSVVVHDLPPDVVAVGNPARVVRRLDGATEAAP